MGTSGEMVGVVWAGWVDVDGVWEWKCVSGWMSGRRIYDGDIGLGVMGIYFMCLVRPALMCDILCRHIHLPFDICLPHQLHLFGISLERLRLYSHLIPFAQLHLPCHACTTQSKPLSPGKALMSNSR